MGAPELSPQRGPLGDRPQWQFWSPSISGGSCVLHGTHGSLTPPSDLPGRPGLILGVFLGAVVTFLSPHT